MFIELTPDTDNQKVILNADAIVHVRTASTRNATLIVTSDGQKHFFSETYEQIKGLLDPKSVIGPMDLPKDYGTF